MQYLQWLRCNPWPMSKLNTLKNNTVWKLYHRLFRFHSVLLSTVLPTLSESWMAAQRWLRCVSSGSTIGGYRPPMFTMATAASLISSTSSARSPHDTCSDCNKAIEWMYQHYAGNDVRTPPNVWKHCCFTCMKPLIQRIHNQIGLNYDVWEANNYEFRKTYVLSSKVAKF